MESAVDNSDEVNGEAGVVNETEENETSINFKPPCLICAAETVTSNDNNGAVVVVVVKQEVNCSAGAVEREDELVDSILREYQTNDDTNEQLSAGPAASGLSGGSGPWTDDEKGIYNQFLKWFRLDLSGKGKLKQNKKNNLGWDGDSGSDPFPFCGECKGHLGDLVSLQRKVEELERTIKQGVEELRGKANEREDVFGGNGIYEKDGRYHRARRQFVADFKLKNPSYSQQRGAHFSKKSESRRKSTRRTTLTGTSDNVPIALLSTRDKSKADQHRDLLNSDIKPEVTSIPEATGVNVDDATSDKPKKKKGRPKKQSITLQPPPSAEEGGGEPSSEFKSLVDAYSLLDASSPDVELPPSPPSPPATPPPACSSGRPARKRKTRLPQNDIIFGEEDEEVPSPPKRKYRPPPKKRSGKWPQQKKRIRDEDDWTLELGTVDPTLLQSSGDEDDALELNDATGKLLYRKSKLDLISKTFTYGTLVFNLQEPLSDNLMTCSECGVEVNRKSHTAPRNHFLRFHSDLYACKLCPFRGKSPVHLSDHVAHVHEGLPAKRKDREVNCQICGRPSRSSSLKAHLWTHKNPEEKAEAIASGSGDVPPKELRSHQCDQCGFNLKSAYELRMHRETVHATAEEKRSKMELCPECGGTYLWLREHRKLVHGVGRGDKVFRCLESEDCKAEFRTLKKLTKHKDAVHRKIRPYQCTQCPRSFFDGVRLQTHMNLHNGVRPWKCDHCPMGYASKSNLQKHVASYHTPGKAPPKRKPFVRGPTMLGADIRKRDLVGEGKYLPPSALASWAAGREPTSHFPAVDVKTIGTDD